MKRAFLTLATVAAFATTAALAEPVHDWHDLDKVHDHVMESIRELERARAVNHYDMAGHGAKAEAALHEAERQLRLAIDSARGAR